MKKKFLVVAGILGLLLVTNGAFAQAYTEVFSDDFNRDEGVNSLIGSGRLPSQGLTREITDNTLRAKNDGWGNSLLLRPLSESTRDGKIEFTVQSLNLNTAYTAVARYNQQASKSHYYAAYVFKNGMAILKAPNNSSPQTYVIGSGNIGVNAGDTLKIEFIVNSVSPTLTRLTLNVYDSDDLLIASITGEDKYAEVQTTGQRGLNSYFSGTYDDVIFSSRETSFDTSPLNFYSDRNTVKFGNSVQFTVSSLDDMVVNLSDNGAGGTFSPSQTVTLTAENTHSTNITYTPATLGNVVISASETSNLVERPLFVSPYSPVMGFIGDSMTALIPNRGKGAVSTAIFQLGAGFLELNNGQNGATTQTRLTSLSDYLINSYKNQNVGIVSIMLGTNDAADSSITPEIYKSNLQSIIDTLWSANVQKIILNESPYNNKVTPEQLEEMEAYRRILDELSDGKKVLRGDTQAYEQIRDLALFGPDQLHPNITGWKMLGELRANAYKTLLIDPYITPSHIFSTGSYYTGDTALIHTTMIDTRAFAHYVTLDGTPLEEEVDYTFTGNEKTEITLLTGYLDTLQTGSYTLTVYFLGTGELGTVEISDIFEVKAVVEETPTPPIVTPPTVPATPSYVGGGGGGSSLVKDSCPTGDLSPSYYDGTCGTTADLTEEVAKKVNVLRPIIKLIYLTATEEQKTFVYNLITSCSENNKNEVIKLSCQELVENWDF